MRGARLALLALLVACARAEEPGSRALQELERLVFVPASTCLLWPSSDLSLSHSIVFDRFEFTRADLRHYWPAGTSRAEALEWSSEDAPFGPEHESWPALVDFDEAQRLAALRGMRLPTPVEWLHVAVGRRGYQNPWGGSGREFFANTLVLREGQDFSLESPCSVGTYENGKSRPFGCYDLLGNVWEWVDGIVLGFEREPYSVPTLDLLDDAHGTKRSILGGAFDSLWRPTFELDRRLNQQRFHARRVDRRTLSPSIGVRMCQTAESYLWNAAPAWGGGPAVAARVRAVAQHWAEDDSARAALVTLVEELRARAGAPPALSWLAEGIRDEP